MHYHAAFMAATVSHIHFYFMLYAPSNNNSRIRSIPYSLIQCPAYSPGLDHDCLLSFFCCIFYFCCLFACVRHFGCFTMIFIRILASAFLVQDFFHDCTWGFLYLVHMSVSGYAWMLCFILFYSHIVNIYHFSIKNVYCFLFFCLWGTVLIILMFDLHVCGLLYYSIYFYCAYFVGLVIVQIVTMISKCAVCQGSTVFSLDHVPINVYSLRVLLFSNLLTFS